ncbi:MAG TPA: YitT family protein [Candidatus Avimuribaculum pullicola]|nr:YitT family protein [Candidatus Avimuribaculum pullicola]
MSKFKKQILGSLKDYIMIILGLALYAFGYTAFILPEKVVMGGMAGIAALIYYKFGIPVAISNFTLNIVLLVIAWRVVGRTFVIRTIFGITTLSALFGILQPLFTEPIVGQQAFMNVLLGALLCGLGVGLAFAHNGSTGGTDIVAAMVSKSSNVTIGRMILYTDVFIISSSYLLFHSIDKIVYGFVILLVVSFVCDYVINTNRQAVQFTIFSEKWSEIADAIIGEAHRGCTLVHGTGWYTKHDVKILLVMCRKIEAVSIFRIIKAIDPHAFVTQANVNGVYGQGFDEEKMKQQIKKSKHKKDGNAAAHIPPLEHNSNIEETADFSQRQI